MVDKNQKNPRKDQERDTSSAEDQRHDLQNTVQFTKEDLERERDRYMTKEEKQRYSNRRSSKTDLDGDYFDRDNQTDRPEAEPQVPANEYEDQPQSTVDEPPLFETRDDTERFTEDDALYSSEDIVEPDDLEGPADKETIKTEETTQTDEASSPSWFTNVSAKGKNAFSNLRGKLSQSAKQKPSDDAQFDQGNFRLNEDLEQSDPSLVDEGVENNRDFESEEEGLATSHDEARLFDQSDSPSDLEDTSALDQPLVRDHYLSEPVGSEQITTEDTANLNYLQADLADIKGEPKPSDPNNEDDNHSFVGGAAWLTAGSIISRVLGALYVIPWAVWLGAEFTQANTLMSVGYKPYSLFLAIATAGFPSAIAKQMAYYHSMKEYKVADKLFKYSLIIMVVTGIVSGGILFVLAPTLAAQSPTVNPEGATLVIRTLVPALLILPVMSLLRGYFQGFNDMKPTAISQILEQLARVMYLLAATYAIMQIYSGNVTEAVAHSTFAAFIGAMVSFLYLVVVYLKRLPVIKKLNDRSLNKVNIDFKASIKIMLLDSVPFILLGSGIIIAQLIDTYTFSQILESTSSLLLIEISELYGVLSHDVDKLMMIIISLAVAIATSAVPTITSSYASGDNARTSELVRKIVTVFTFIMLPAALGMAAVSNNVYQFFYAEGSSAGPSLLVTGAISSIALGAYTVFSTILQSMNYRRLAVRYLVIGLLIKLIAQYPFVALLQAHGALLATMLGFTVASILMWLEINKHLSIDYTKLKRDVLQIVVTALVMMLVTALWNTALNQIFGIAGRGITLIKVILAVAIGAFTYLFGMGIQGKLYILLGDKFSELQEKLRMF